MNQRGEEGGVQGGGEGGTPAGSQASWLAVPILASDGFCQRGEERVSSSLGHGRIDVLSVGGGGDSGGEWRDAERGRKPRDPSSQGLGWPGWAALLDWADVEMGMIY